MKLTSAPLPNFIVAGASKAATTSIFHYLRDHPQVCTSSAKETNFFFKDYSGDLIRDSEVYWKYFRHCKPDARVIMEASPGYLVHCREVAPRMRDMLADVKLLFILREPVARIYSYYNFVAARIPPDFDKKLSFDNYVEKCMKYTSGRMPAQSLNVGERHLRNLQVGLYAQHLKVYYQYFPKNLIKVMFYEHLKEDARRFMYLLCDYLRINKDFYNNYTFNKENMTLIPRIRLLHRFIRALSHRTEPFLQDHPKLKTKILRAYSMVNQRQQGYDQIPEETKCRLQTYYQPANQELQELLRDQQCPSWVKT